MILPYPYEIETPNFKLSSICLDDISHVFSGISDEEHVKHMSIAPVKTQEEVRQLILHQMKVWKERKYNFIIKDKNSSESLGHIAIRKSTAANVWNMGYWTHPQHQGKGIMSECCHAILDLGFNTLNAKRIVAFHAISNKASERVLKKNGFKFDKYYEKGFQKNGVWIEENLLAIHKEEWDSIYKTQ